MIKQTLVPVDVHSGFYSKSSFCVMHFPMLHPFILFFVFSFYSSFACFSDYLFNKSSKSGLSKFDVIRDHVTTLLIKYPQYRVYTTGHSLGGALSVLLAFQLCSIKSIPKPILYKSYARTKSLNFGIEFHVVRPYLQNHNKAVLRIIADVKFDCIRSQFYARHAIQFPF